MEVDVQKVEKMNSEELQALKKRIRAAGLSGAEIARYLGYSSSWINSCLNGHYPWKYAGDFGKAILPRCLEEFLRDRRLL